MRGEPVTPDRTPIVNDDEKDNASDKEVKV